MAALSPREPCLAVVAPPALDVAECVTGTVVVDQHEKDIKTLHSQIRFMTVFKTVDRRSLSIVSHIADGTWSSVYSAREDDTRPCALKVFPIEGANVDHAYADIELLKRLHHPNVVQYYSHFTCRAGDVRCLCIQLEYCGQGTLVDFIRTKAHGKSPLAQVPASQVQDFTAQLASALAYIHEQGFLHGDLRPESVLIAKKQLKLTSFGSPLWIDRRGLAPRTITGGCKAYAPPEWMDSVVPHRPLQPAETPLPSYDMWSLGCVLSELATLKLLRNDRHYLRTALAADLAGLEAVKQEVAAAHGGLFSALLDQLLEPDADERLSAPEALAALQALHSHRGHSLVTALRRPLSHFPMLSPRQT